MSRLEGLITSVNEEVRDAVRESQRRRGILPGLTLHSPSYVSLLWQAYVDHSTQIMNAR